MKKFIIAFTFIAFCSALQAMALTVDETRQMRLQAFLAMQNYEKWLQWVGDGPTYRDKFLGLFDSGSAPVYNDLLGMSDEQQLPIDQYVDLLSDGAQEIEVTIKQMSMSPVTMRDGKWVIDVEVDKEMNYKNNCGIRMESASYHKGNDYHLVAHMAWVPEDSTCVITSIEGSIDSGREQLGTQYSALERQAQMDNSLRVNGHTPEFNRYDIWLDTYPLTVKYPDPDIIATVKQADDMCNIFTVSYKYKRFRLKPWFTMGLGNFYAITTNTNTSVSTDDAKSSGMEFGVDFGYNFPIKSAVKVGVYAGVGFSTSKLDMKFNSAGFDYYTNEDIDQDFYKRRYTDVRLESSYKFSDFVVPLYFDVEIPLFSKVCLFADAGMKLYMSTSAKASIDGGTYKVDGLYPGYGNLVLGESAGINGFTESGVILGGSSLPLERKSISADVFGRAGFRVMLAGAFGLDLGVSYQSGIGDCYSNTTVTASDTGLLQYDAYDGVERLNLPAAVTKITRRFLGVNIGLFYKF